MLVQKPSHARLFFQAGRFRVGINRPLVMGILNVTPDSFSDPGLHLHLDQAIASAWTMKEQGADLIDIGGESTRPGSASVDTQEEVRRVLPVVRLLQDLGLPLSLDTRRPAVARQALDLGIDMVNDVSGFRDPDWRPFLLSPAARGLGLCVVHMQGQPKTMQANPSYRDVTAEVFGFLRGQSAWLQSECRVQAEQILLDPGFGFGKNLDHNLTLFRCLPELIKTDRVLVGVSRKRMLGDLIERESLPSERLGASISGAMAAATHGAHVLRVHDVGQTVDALKVWRALGGDPSACSAGGDA